MNNNLIINIAITQLHKQWNYITKHVFANIDSHPVVAIISEALST